MYYIRITDHIKGVLVVKFSLAIDKIKTSLGAGDARVPSEFGASLKGQSLISAYQSLAITASTSGFEKLSTVLNSERSEQLLVTECFFNLFLEVSHI